jgi:hypothetical protein
MKRKFKALLIEELMVEEASSQAWLASFEILLCHIFWCFDSTC